MEDVWGRGENRVGRGENRVGMGRELGMCRRRARLFTLAAGLA